MARKLRVNVTVGTVTYGPDYPDNEVTAEVAAELKGLKVWEGDDPDEEAPADPEPTSYEAMTHDGLQEEIRNRNAAGADLKVSGSKADLIARLTEHDGS